MAQTLQSTGSPWPPGYGETNMNQKGPLPRMSGPLTSKAPLDAAAQPEPTNPAAAPAAAFADDFDRDVWCVLGLPVDRATTASALGEVEAAARTGRRLSFVTPNVNFLARAWRDRAERRRMIATDYSVADGAPLVLLARLLGAPVTERVAGSDLFEALAAQPGFRGRRMRVFFFGGRDGAAERAAKVLNARRGGLEAVGWLNPGHGDVASMSADAIIDEINAAAPDFIVVALGAAKGQAWIAANEGRLEAPVISHLGAVIDFTAGTVRRAPKLVARSGFEWLWRIGAEPALARRYIKDAATVAAVAAKRLPALLRKQAPTGAPATASLRRAGTSVVVSLAGDLCAGALAPVRRAFREAAGMNAPVILDMAEAGAVDGAFFGLVLMLEKNLPEGALSVAGLTAPMRALFAANAMPYPETAAADADDPAAESVATAAAG